MRFALLCQAESHYDNMMEGIDENGPAWVLDNESELHYLPTPVKQKLENQQIDARGIC